MMVVETAPELLDAGAECRKKKRKEKKKKKHRLLRPPDVLETWGDEREK